MIVRDYIFRQPLIRLKNGSINDDKHYSKNKSVERLHS
jgi:hypothetical protein